MSYVETTHNQMVETLALASTRGYCSNIPQEVTFYLRMRLKVIYIHIYFLTHQDAFQKKKKSKDRVN